MEKKAKLDKKIELFNLCGAGSHDLARATNSFVKKK
jgi:hypothetical protein